LESKGFEFILGMD
jgi:hypothetical protein